MSSSGTTLHGRLAGSETGNGLENPRACPLKGMGPSTWATPLMTPRDGLGEVLGHEAALASPLTSNYWS